MHASIMIINSLTDGPGKLFASPPNHVRTILQKYDCVMNNYPSFNRSVKVIAESYSPA